jgi:hypothetical protein
LTSEYKTAKKPKKIEESSEVVGRGERAFGPSALHTCLRNNRTTLSLTHSLGVGFTRVVFSVLLFAAFWDVVWHFTSRMFVSFHIPFHFFLYFMYYAVIYLFWGGRIFAISPNIF